MLKYLPSIKVAFIFGLITTIALMVESVFFSNEPFEVKKALFYFLWMAVITGIMNYKGLFEKKIKN